MDAVPSSLCTFWKSSAAYKVGAPDEVRSVCSGTSLPNLDRDAVGFFHYRSRKKPVLRFKIK